MSEHIAAAQARLTGTATEARQLGVWGPQDTIDELTRGLRPLIEVRSEHLATENDVLDTFNAVNAVAMFVHAAYALSASGRRRVQNDHVDVIPRGGIGMGIRVDNMGDAGVLTGHGNSRPGQPLDYEVRVPFRRSGDGKRLLVPNGPQDTLPTACVVDSRTGTVSVLGHQTRGLGTLAPGQSGSDPLAAIVAMQTLARETVLYLHGEGGNSMYAPHMQPVYVPLSEF